MPYYCTVPRCTSMAGKAKNVSFHQFPRDEELAKLWNRILKRGKPYTKYSKVCSLHFKPEDYTITSVGKNKGQWRTLRKDAIPSQNLPSESPAPYTRRSSGCWVPNQPSLTDPLVQQQMAQAIYMQTMLAMQTAGASDSLPSAEPPQPSESKPSPSSSSLSEIEILLRRDRDPKEVTFKCHECSKCFKDPDVFLLHKRTHKNDTTLNIEKENYSANIQDREETLRANPILANLLKTSMRLEPESNMTNILTVENQIMAALASNMEAYIRTLSSMLASQSNAIETEDNRQVGSDYEDETKDEDDGVERDAAKVKSEEDESVYENESKDEDNEVERDSAKVECEDMEKDMCVEQDTPMDEDQEDVHSDRSEDENIEEILNNLSTRIASDENQMETLTNENVYPSEVRSIDDTTKDDCEAHNRQIDDHSNASDDSSINDDSTENINEASNYIHNHKSSSNETNSRVYEAPNEAIIHENEIRNGGTENDGQENHMCTEDGIDDTTRNTYNADDTLDVNTDASDTIDDNDTSKDEMSDDDGDRDDGELVQGTCDSEVELTKVDVEYET